MRRGSTSRRRSASSDPLSAPNLDGGLRAIARAGRERLGFKQARWTVEPSAVVAEGLFEFLNVAHEAVPWIPISRPWW